MGKEISRNAKRKAIQTGNILWLKMLKLRIHTNVNQKSREALYNWILNHSHVVQYPISNYCLYVSIDGNTKSINAKIFIASFCTRTS